MAQKQGGGKKKRAHKVSRGIHGGGGKVTLTLLQQTLLGKGPLLAPRKVDPKAPTFSLYGEVKSR